MCGKVRHAVGAVASGCDFVVAQGTEAGGHTGTVATIALVPQVVDAVGDQVPVVAAGGLYDGRGLAAALTLGADGVWIGTRFIATPEARSVAGYKETLLATPEDGTVISRAYTGKTCRVVRNDWTQHFEEHPDELQPFPAQVARLQPGRRQPPRRARRHGRRHGARVLPVRPGRRRHPRAGAGRRARAPDDGRGRARPSPAPAAPCDGVCAVAVVVLLAAAARAAATMTDRTAPAVVARRRPAVRHTEPLASGSASSSATTSSSRPPTRSTSRSGC